MFSKVTRTKTSTTGYIIYAFSEIDIVNNFTLKNYHFRQIALGQTDRQGWTDMT